MSRPRSKYINTDGLRFRLGSLVYQQNVCIYNMGAAHDCPSDAQGMCDCSSSCYGKRPEKIWGAVIKARRNQGVNWKSSSTEHFIHALKYLHARHNVELFRFNEVSDFATQQDVEKMNEIASSVPQIVFGYTANYKLDYSGISSSLLIKMSHFDHICEGINGRTTIIEKGEKPPRGFITCLKTDKSS